MTLSWQDSTTVGSYGPGGWLQCPACGRKVEVLGPYASAVVRIQEGELPNDVHRALQCRHCGKVLMTYYTMRPDAA